jgi:hypothetical protein
MTRPERGTKRKVVGLLAFARRGAASKAKLAAAFKMLRRRIASSPSGPTIVKHQPPCRPYNKNELSAPDDQRIVFRLKKPFPHLAQALAGSAANVAFIMPERLASTDP